MKEAGGRMAMMNTLEIDDEDMLQSCCLSYKGSLCECQVVSGVDFCWDHGTGWKLEKREQPPLLFFKWIYETFNQFYFDLLSHVHCWLLEFLFMTTSKYR